MKYLAIIFLLIFSFNSKACGCPNSPRLDDWIKRDSSMIFHAKLLNTREVDPFLTELTFEVIKPYKGEFNKNVLINIKSDRTSCGYQLTNSTNYILFYNKNDRKLHQCANSVRRYTKELENELINKILTSEKKHGKNK